MSETKRFWIRCHRGTRFLTGKTWNIPENAEKPERSNKKKEQTVTLLGILQDEKKSKYFGGIYHKTQIDLTYNSNHKGTYEADVGTETCLWRTFGSSLDDVSASVYDERGISFI